MGRMVIGSWKTVLLEAYKENKERKKKLEERMNELERLEEYLERVTPPYLLKMMEETEISPMRRETEKLLQEAKEVLEALNQEAMEEWLTEESIKAAMNTTDDEDENE